MKNINRQASHPPKAHSTATAQDAGSTRQGLVQATDASGKNGRNDRVKADIGQQFGPSARKKMSGHPQAANHSRPIPRDSMHPQSPATPQTPEEPLPSSQPGVKDLPQAAHHQRSSTYPLSANGTHATGNAQDPGNPRFAEYTQALRSPERYAYPQSASHPEPSGHPQMQNDTAAFVYQATPAHAPSSGQTYVQGLPPDMAPYNQVYYDAARNSIFPQVSWNAGYYYTEQPSNIGAPWQAEPPHWLQDIQDSGYVWRNGAPSRCGDRGCCRNCCGECCEREDAKRWEREQLMRESSLPCIRRPRIRNAHEHLEVDFADDPFSWASNEAVSTSRYHYKPLREGTCQPIDLVPRGLDVTYSLSPPGSWASYSLRTSHGPPPIRAPPSTVNMRSNVCFSDMEPPQPSFSPEYDTLYRVSSRIVDVGRGRTEQPRPEQSRLRALEFETKVEQRQRNVSSSDHGWYQPLHITSQISSSTGERSTGATVHFLNFTWGSPERVPARGSDKALAVPVIKDARPETNPFSWSSKAFLKVREPTVTQEFKPATEVLRDGAAHHGSLSSHDVYPKASKLASPVVLSTNLLHSATSENGDARVDIGSPGSLPHETTSPLFEPVMGDQPETYHFVTSEEEEMEAVEGNLGDKEEEEPEDKEEDENEEKEGGDSDDMHEKARGEDEEAGEEEYRRKKRDRKERHLAAVAPVAVAKASGKKRSKESEDAERSGSEASAGQADEERNPETGVSDAVRPLDELSSSSFKSAKGKPSPSRSKSRVKAAASVVSSLSHRELTPEQEEAADEAGERMDKEMRDLELTTVELYPESRLVVLLAILCLIWIIFLVLSSVVKHGLPPSTDEGSATATTVTTAIYPTWWTPVTRVTPPTGPANTSTTTQHPLRGIFICSSDYCQKEGNYLRSLTAHSTKTPCENFYEHVCGAWKKVATRLIQSVAGAAVSTDTMLQASMEARLLAYIKNRAHADVNPARMLYDMCMNRGAASSALSDAKKLLRQWGSDWPQKDSANSSPADVWRFAAKLMQGLGVPSLVGIEIGLDPWNIELNIIELGPPRTVFYSKDVSEPRVMKLFSDATRTAAKALDPDDPSAGSAAAKDVGIALASISLLQLDDLGTSPLDFQVMKFTALGNGVQLFLRTVFANVVTIDSSTRILAHRSPLVRQELDETVNTLPPRVMLNYLGLLALVALSPFLPEQLSSLRVLHSVHTLGRAETGSNDLMCLRAVSQAYPACLAAASHALYKNTQRSVWLSHLESLFVGYVRNVVWMDNLTSLFVRYKMRHHRLARFFPVWPLGDCNATNKTASSRAINTFVDAVGRRQTQELQQHRLPVVRVASVPAVPAVVPDTRGGWSMRRCRPSSSVVSPFTCRAWRCGLYASLAQLLYEGTVYEREIPLYFTEEAERALEDLLDCLLCDARHRFPHGLRAERVQNALLEQVRPATEFPTMLTRGNSFASVYGSCNARRFSEYGNDG
ncbi:hypothetical protein HPB51_028534 [Rhipicephalus microplus]|uniref:Peptidase M13 N-terminal domain-containing protein n=1 Tax=Rhipicephalus microplus TaxID=6941 RepID=A0A9J6CWT1_RHIMP|nr:hypothetical protein HPB51_028534 [Rhipicephalus microplus]